METLILNWNTLYHPSKETIDARDRFFEKCDKLKILEEDNNHTIIELTEGD